MERAARQRWRAQGVPLGYDIDKLTALLRGHPSLQIPISADTRGEAAGKGNGARVLTLADDLPGRKPKRTATVHFENLPPQLIGRQTLVLELESSPSQLRQTKLTIDQHFSDLTVLYSPPAAASNSTDSKDSKDSTDSPTTSDPQVNILFVSGLNCHPIGSFVNKDNGHLWLTDDLPDDRPNARILTYGYDTKLVNSQSVAEIRTLGENLRAAIHQLLTQLPIPLVIVSHSLGGLIVKDALFLMSGYRTELDALARLTTVYFFGVPHNGMENEHLLPMVNMQPNQMLVASLSKISSQALRALREDWLKTLDRAPFDIFCFYELLPSPTAVKTDQGWKMGGPEQLLVDVTSARNCFRQSDSSEHPAIGVQSNHSNLVKFGPSDSTYQRFLHYLDQSCARRRAGHSLSQSRGDSMPEFTEEDKQKLLNSLAFGQIDDRYGAIDNSHGTTCEWLITSPEWRNWLDPEKVVNHHGLLWIKGHAGTGKSTLMKFAVDNAPDGFQVVSFFFNARSHHELEKTTLGMYRSVLHQLLEPLPAGVTQSILKSAKVKVRSSANHYKWTLPQLTKLLRATVKRKPWSIPIMIFIDALDECETQEVRDMITLFEDLDNTSEASGMRVCLASRYYPEIGTTSRVVQLKLEAQQGHADDIDMYISNRLKLGDSEDERSIRACLRERAGRVFMWVVLVIRMLNEAYYRGRQHELLQTLEALPDDLNLLFVEVISRHRRNLDDFRMCLTWVLWGKRPLTPTELYDAIVSRLNDDATGRSAREELQPGVPERFILDVSRGLVEVRSLKGKTDTVQVIHESVRNFLFSPEGYQKIDPESWLHNEGESHEKLSRWSLHYLNINFDKLNPTLLARRRSQRAKIRPLDRRKVVLPSGCREYFPVAKELPFFVYALRGGLVHADGAENAGLDQSSFLQTFQLSRWVYLNNIFARFVDVSTYTVNVSVLYILVDLGLHNLIERCPGRSECFREEKEEFGAPIVVALGRIPVLKSAHESLTKWDGITTQLLKYHAQTLHIEPSSPLHRLYAQEPVCRPGMSYRNSPAHEGELITRLFALGTQKAAIAAVYFFYSTRRQDGDINFQAPSGRTLFNFCFECLDFQENEALLRLLLQDGADINAGYAANQPLYLASSVGRVADIKFLVDQGADVNHIVEYDRHYPNVAETALHQCVKKGNHKIVKILLENGANPNSKSRIGYTPLEETTSVGYTRPLEGSASVGDTHVELVGSEVRWVDNLMVQILLEHGADPGADCHRCSSPIYYCISTVHGAHRSAEERISMKDMMVRLRGFDPLHDPPLWWILGEGMDRFAQGSFLDHVRSLLDEPDGVHRTTPYERTLLWWAARYGRTEVVRLLLDQGANVDQASEVTTRGLGYSGEPATALGAAAAGGHLDIVQILLNAGADVNTVEHMRYKTLLLYAHQYVHFEGVNYLLVHPGTSVAADVHREWARGSNGLDEILRSSLLREACRRHNDSIVNALHTLRGTKPLKVNVALHYACETGSVEIMRLLLERGASVNITGLWDRTPLSYACESGEILKVQLLLEHGADAGLWDCRSRSPLDYAREHGHQEIVDLLESQGVDQEKKG